MSILFGNSSEDNKYYRKVQEEENERIDKLAANIIAITAESFLIKSTKSLVTLSAPSLSLRTL